MNRFDIDEDGCEMREPEGPLVWYEEARLIEVDRDIKAANLQLLVEKVLEASVLLDMLQDDEDSAVTGIFSYSTKEAIAKSRLVVDLARSLKQ